MHTWQEIEKAKKWGWFQQYRDEYFEGLGDFIEEDKLEQED